MRIETRMEVTDRLAYEAAIRAREAQAILAAQRRAADAILSRNLIEHVTVWTDAQGSHRHSSRLEVLQ